MFASQPVEYILVFGRILGVAAEAVVAGTAGEYEPLALTPG